jgi:hypothetical protein
MSTGSTVKPLLAAPAVEQVLLGPRDALEHRVDRLEVGGVGGQVDLALLPLAR